MAPAILIMGFVLSIFYIRATSIIEKNFDEYIAESSAHYSALLEGIIKQKAEMLITFATEWDAGLPDTAELQAQVIKFTGKDPFVVDVFFGYENVSST